MELGSSIQRFDAVHAVQTAFVSIVHTATQTAVNAIKTVFGAIGDLVGGTLFVLALPVEIPLALYFFYSIVNSPLWF